MVTLPKGMNEHYGRNVDRMPALLRTVEVPMSAARLMKARLEQGANTPDLWNNYFDTSDLVVYPKGNDKNVYFLLTVDNQGDVTPNGRKALDLIRPGNLASNYGAKVDKISSLGRKGLIKVSRNGLTTDRYLSQEQALNEVAWRILSRHPDEVPTAFAEDKALLKEYEARVRSKTRQGENMAVYLGDSLADENTLKAWCVYWLEGGSVAFGRCYLDGSNGRFVGIAPEAQVASGRAKDLVQRVDPSRVFSVSQVLEEAGLASDYASNQITKLQNTLEQGGYRITK